MPERPLGEFVEPELIRLIEEDGDETIGVFLFLRIPLNDDRPRIEDYQNRDAWRDALRADNRRRIEQVVTPTAEAIRQLGLEPLTEFAGDVLVFGKPQQIRQAIALPTVDLVILHSPRAMLDERVEDLFAASTTTVAR